MHSQFYERFDETLQKHDDAELKLVVAASKGSAHRQQVSAQRHSSRHQVGSFEHRAFDDF